MDSTPGVKSQGMKFAEELLQRHGWTEGKGLGKRESGISEAIKVKVKCDSAGVGHNSAEQFTFHWWDHVFNKTASSIAVEPDQDGVQVKKVTDEDSAVTNKKPRKALNNPNMLYGRFIKSATLLSGGEKPVEKEAESSSDSSEDEDQKLDLSSATKLTDDDLVKICGGRTAHKGARHGLKMSAKLSRIEEQERAFLEKYGKKTSTEEPASRLTLDKEAETARKKEKCRSDVTNEEDSSTSIPRKKKKNKRRNEDEDVLEVDGTNGYEVEDPTTSKRNKDLKEILSDVDEDTARGSGQLLETDLKSSKKKKKKKKAADEEAEGPEDHTCSIEEDGRASKKKKKAADGPENHDRSTEDDIRASKKKAVDEDDNGSEDHAQSTEDDIRASKKKKKAADEVADGPTDHAQSADHVRSSKKKKKAAYEVTEQADGPEDHAQSTDHVRSSKKKKKAAYEEVTEQADGSEDHTPSTEDDIRASKKKRRKSKANDYVNEDLLSGQEEDLRLTKMEKEDEELLNGHDEQAPSEPSKKKKRRKDLEDNLEEQPQDEPTEEHVQPAKKKKRQRKAEDIEKQESMKEEQCQSVKNKKSRMKCRDSPTPEEEEEQGHDEQSTEHKRKKKRKDVHMD